MVTATYAGGTGVNGSVGTATVTVTPVAGSNVIAAATVKPATSQGRPITIQLQETGGITATVTGFSISGTNLTSAIGALFGTTKLPAKGTLTGNLIVMGTVPPSLVFAFTGTDANGRQWSQTVTAVIK
jgi:hypothetical protein